MTYGKNEANPKKFILHRFHFHLNLQSVTKTIDFAYNPLFHSSCRARQKQANDILLVNNGIIPILQLSDNEHNRNQA